MFLVFLFKAYNFFVFNYYTPILELIKISTHIKYFSNYYVICTSSNNDIYNEFRKRKINELEEELMRTTNIKNEKAKNLSSSSSLLPKSEVYSKNSLENNQLEVLD